MLKRPFTGIVLTAVGVFMLASNAFAAESFYGHITSHSDTTVQNSSGEVTREVSIEFKDCDGSELRFHFRENSNLDLWVTQIESYLESNQMLNVGVEQGSEVSVMATTDATCEQLAEIRDVYDQNDEEEDEDADADEDDHVLAPRPDGMMMNDKFPVRHDFRLKTESSADAKMSGNMDLKVKHRLVNELRGENHGQGNMERLHMVRRMINKRMNLRNADRHVAEIEAKVGLSHVNPIKLSRQLDKMADGQEVTLKGIYKASAGENMLVNADGELLVSLDMQGKDYSAFAGQRVFIKGLGYRSDKMVKVESMRALNKNESDKNNAQMHFRVGASLYNDVDTNDDSVWFAEYLHDLFDKGVLTGYEDGSFGGANPVTIAEIAKVVAESAEHDVDTRSTIEAKLKHRNHWAKFYLHHAAEFDLLHDTDMPDRGATRAEVLEAILRAYGVDPSLDAGLPDPFPDTKDAFIRKAFKLGIVSGFPDGEFRPDAMTNRAEIAKMMTLAKEKLAENDEGEDTDDLFEELEGMSEEELEEWLNETEAELEVESESEIEFEDEVETQ